MKKHPNQRTPAQMPRPRPPEGIIGVLFLMIILAASPPLFAAQKTAVRVHLPQSVSKDFNILIDIDNAYNLDSGQFDLAFDPGAIQILNVGNGAIGDTVVPVDLWATLNPGKIRVLFNFPGVQGICGTGHLAKIRARAIGKAGHPEPLAIQNGLLVDKEAQSIPSRWVDGKVNIEGCAEKAKPTQAIRSGQAPDTGTSPPGMTISTPMAVAGLTALALLPALLLVFLRKRKRRH